MLVTTTLSLYYLPKLSELKDSAEIKKEILQGYKIILPLAALCGITIYLLRDLIIEILFASNFAPMRELFAWQMIGDTLKIGSWILAYLMLGKAMVKLFICTEVIFAANFYLLSLVLTGVMGLEGVATAYSINYALYWFVLAVLLRAKFFSGRHLR